MKALALMVILLPLSGCAALQAKLEAMQAKATPGSYVASEISESDANEVAMDMAEFLAARLPAAKTTLDLQLSANKLQTKLVDQLMVRGFGIIQSKVQSDQEGTVMLQYKITRLDAGVLVRLRYGGHMATRYLSRAPDGRLSRQNKYAVREVAK